MQQEGSDEMVLEDSYITIAWLVLLIILLVVEIITVGLTSIWAADSEHSEISVSCSGRRVFCSHVSVVVFHETVRGEMHQQQEREDQL